MISAYFEAKGLVRQQLDSFDEFIQNTMQEIVDESPDIVLTPEAAGGAEQVITSQHTHVVYLRVYCHTFRLGL